MIETKYKEKKTGKVGKEKRRKREVRETVLLPELLNVIWIGRAILRKEDMEALPVEFKM